MARKTSSFGDRANLMLAYMTGFLLGIGLGIVQPARVPLSPLADRLLSGGMFVLVGAFLVVALVQMFRRERRWEREDEAYRAERARFDARHPEILGEPVPPDPPRAN